MEKKETKSNKQSSKKSNKQSAKKSKRVATTKSPVDLVENDAVFVDDMDEIGDALNEDLELAQALQREFESEDEAMLLQDDFQSKKTVNQLLFDVIVIVTLSLFTNSNPNGSIRQRTHLPQ
jgi:hypothetical protein